MWHVNQPIEAQMRQQMKTNFNLETYVITKINALSSLRCILKSCKEVNSIIESTSYCLSYNIQLESNIKKNGRPYFQTKGPSKDKIKY